MNNETMAEMAEWQARTRDLETSLEQVRTERDSARASCDLQMHEIMRLEEENRQLLALVGRLRLHIQQGVEL